MTFRKTSNEYVKTPVGVTADYAAIDGAVIDSQGNVYLMEGANYLKIGYDMPILDTYVQHIPKIGFGIALANAFAPKWSKREDRDWLEIIIGFLVALYILLAFEIISWLGYQLITLFAKPILEFTKDKLFLRRFLPCVWFMDTPNKDQMSVARGSVMFIPYLIIFFIWLSEGTGPFGLIILIFMIISGAYTFFNYKINKLIVR